ENDKGAVRLKYGRGRTVEGRVGSGRAAGAEEKRRVVTQERARRGVAVHPRVESQTTTASRGAKATDDANRVGGYPREEGVTSVAAEVEVIAHSEVRPSREHAVRAEAACRRAVCAHL